MDRNRALRIMQEYELEGLVATTQENVAFASGFRTAESRANYNTQIYAVVPADPGRPVGLVIPTISLTYVAQLGLAPEQVWTYGEFYFYVEEGVPLSGAAGHMVELLAGTRPYANGMAALQAALEAARLGRGRLGLDEMGIAPTVLQKLQSTLTNEVVYGYDAFRKLRAVKTPDEIARLRVAAEIVEEAVRAAMAVMRPGVTHREILATYKATVARRGAIPTHVNFRFGANGGLPSLLPSDTPLEAGQLMAWDVGLIYELYQADTARCAVVGEPEPRQQMVYDALLAGLQAGISAIRPGATAGQVFDAAVAAVRACGLPDYKRNHCGHGIGVEAYDEPLLAPNNPTVIEPGMVLNVETPYYRMGFGSPVVEDTVVVTDTGVEYLTQMDRSLMRLA
jgi:Xaa-Pro dipeptidase